MNRGVADTFFQKMFCGGIAHDAPIEVPADAPDVEAYCASVRERCLEGQRGFYATLSFSQLAWMCQVGYDGTLDEAARAASGMNIVDVACVGGPDSGPNVVVEPTARDFYLERIQGAKPLEVPRNHTDFEQFVPSWRGHMNSALALLDKEGGRK